MVVQATQNLIKESSKPIVIKAFATWCPHCAKMSPIFEKLEKELNNKYTFAEFDTDQSPEFVQEFNISSLPTFIFIKNKQDMGRVIGEMTQNDLKAAIEKYLAH